MLATTIKERRVKRHAWVKEQDLGCSALGYWDATVLHKASTRTLGSNGTTVLFLLALLGVGEVGDNGSDTLGRRALAGIDHDQQLHQRVVNLGRSRLDNVNILVTDRDT